MRSFVEEVELEEGAIKEEIARCEVDAGVVISPEQLVEVFELGYELATPFWVREAFRSWLEDERSA